MFQEYFLTYHKEELIKILTLAPEETKHLALNISFVKLFENDPKLGNMILKDAEKVLESLDKALVNIQKMLAVKLNTTEILEKVVHTRIYGLPSCHDQSRISIPRSVDLHLFLQITGSVIRTTLVKMLEFRRHFKCSKCKYQMEVDAVYEQKYIIFPPKKCLNPDGCGSYNIIALNCLDANNCKDFQEIKIQEQISKSSLGNMPSSIWVTLENDLVDMCKPGDNITVCGILKSRWDPFILNKKISCELVLKANHLQVNNAQSSSVLVTPDIRNFFHSFWKKYRNRPILGRDIIVKSVCPQIYGLHTVKLAVGMVLASGSRMQDIQETGVRTRSESHLLLVGDPGTGKSQILKFAAKIIPRSVLTTGIGSTSAGLTVTAIQENGEWQLEGGALVLADGGICCIDEFNSMKERDRTSIHEAMEQQTISVAKASIVCKLSTRCSILAAINPKGKFDLSQPLSLNVGMPSPLLSRFDIILILQDTVDAVWDEVVCDHILDRLKKNGKNDPGMWEIDLLRAYFSYIKDIQPNLTPQANRILGNYYQAQRRSFAKNRVTVRLLDSLVRLSKAHARLMFHDEVHVMDAVNAVIMMESSMHGAILDLNVNSLHSPFPGDPMQSYNQLARSILEKLELVDILNDELMRLTKLAEQRASEDDSSMSFERATREHSRLLSRLNHNYEIIKHNENHGDLNDFFVNKKDIKENNDVSKNNKKPITNKKTNLFEDNESDEDNRKRSSKSDLVYLSDEVVKKELFVKNIKDTDSISNNLVKYANKFDCNSLKENIREQISDNKETSTKQNPKDFLSKFKFTKRRNEDDNSNTSALKLIVEKKDISTFIESNNLQDKGDHIDSKDNKNEEANKDNNSESTTYEKENRKCKRKRNIDEFGTPLEKKKKAKEKLFDSEVQIDIENDIDWNLGAIINVNKEMASPLNTQTIPLSEIVQKSKITSQSSSRGLFEFEDDNVEDWDF